jgi:hypothetical protein
MPKNNKIKTLIKIIYKIIYKIKIKKLFYDENIRPVLKYYINAEQTMLILIIIIYI